MDNWFSSLDPDQIKAVSSSTSAVVTAGAGSGKTSVLAYRYLYLLKQQQATVDSLLTLTFTRKTATEMYERIYRLLREHAEDPVIKPQLDRFDQAWISTLDSFCSFVVRSDALPYGLSPTFTTEDQAVWNLLYQEALSFLVDEAEGPMVDLIQREGGIETILSSLTELAFNEFVFSKPVSFDMLLEKQFQSLQKEREEELKRLKQDLELLLAIDLTGTRGKEADRARETQREVADRLKELFDQPLEIIEYLKNVRLPGRVPEEDLERYKNTLVRIQGEKRQRLDLLIRLIKTEESRSELASVYPYLEKFQQRIQRLKQLRGILTFKDVAEMAVDILMQNKSLRQWFKQKFKAILIDEFQDNNQLQKNLLYLLAEREDTLSDGIPSVYDLDPTKLFFVGDEKQSIYRFRGADVRVLKGLAEELAQAGGREVHLSYNYRSHPDLIRFFNYLFERLMPQSGSARDNEARFEPLKSPVIQSKDAIRGDDATGAGEAKKEGCIPRVFLFYKKTRKDAEDTGTDEIPSVDSDDAEAYFLAKQIRSWVESGSLLVWDRKLRVERPARYEDFAILLRSTSNLIRYERMLRLCHVPYTTSGIRSLFLESPVNDIYALLQCVLYPQDRLAYAALLRSPFVGMGDEQVIELLLQEASPFEPEEGLGSFSEEEREKFQKGRDLYREVQKRLDTTPIPELLSYLWYEGGYRYYVLRSPAFHSYLELYDYLREFALLGRGESVQAFLDRLRPNLGKYERIPELEIQRDQVEGVQILTLHRAKGLQFPVVLIANAGNTGRKGSGSAPFYMSERYGITVRLGERQERYNYFYEVGKKENEEAEKAELKRLFYVGCTRAESFLVISGVLHKRNQESEQAFLSLLAKALGTSGPLPDSSPFEKLPEQIVSVIEVREIPEVPEENIIAPYQPPTLSKDQIQTLYQHSLSPAQVNKTLYSVTEIAEEPPFQGSAAVQEKESKPSEIPGKSAPIELPPTSIDPLLQEKGKVLEEYFGSLCHAVVEDLLEGQGNLEQREKINRWISEFRREAAAGNKLQQYTLPPGELPRTNQVRRSCSFPEHWVPLFKEALRLALQFLQTDFARTYLIPFPIGTKLDPEFLDPTCVEIEVPFVLKQVEPTLRFVRGRMDLVLHLREGKKETWVLDFKTDRYLNVHYHKTQIVEYRKAAYALWGKPVQVYLVYLRSGEVQLASSS
ncbi:MAG: UvrD-helicase domain-containing protein [Spirochaetales bacterium]